MNIERIKAHCNLYSCGRFQPCSRTRTSKVIRDDHTSHASIIKKNKTFWLTKIVERERATGKPNKSLLTFDRYILVNRRGDHVTRRKNY